MVYQLVRTYLSSTFVHKRSEVSNKILDMEILFTPYNITQNDGNDGTFSFYILFKVNKGVTQETTEVLFEVEYLTLVLSSNPWTIFCHSAFQ